MDQQLSPLNTPAVNAAVPVNELGNTGPVENILAPELQAPAVQEVPVAPRGSSSSRCLAPEPPAPEVPVVEAREEESFHSPFSSDLPEVEASVAGSRSQALLNRLNSLSIQETMNLSRSSLAWA